MVKLIGKIVKYSQYIENHLEFMIYLYVYSNNSLVNIDELYNEYGGKTLGELIKGCDASSLISKDLKKDLYYILNNRNIVVHDLYNVDPFPSIFKRTKIKKDKKELTNLLKILKQTDKKIVFENKNKYKLLKKKDKKIKRLLRK